MKNETIASYLLYVLAFILSFFDSFDFPILSFLCLLAATVFLFKKKIFIYDLERRFFSAKGYFVSVCTFIGGVLVIFLITFLRKKVTPLFLEVSILDYLKNSLLPFLVILFISMLLPIPILSKFFGKK